MAVRSWNPLLLSASSQPSAKLTQWRLTDVWIDIRLHSSGVLSSDRSLDVKAIDLSLVKSTCFLLFVPHDSTLGLGDTAKPSEKNNNNQQFELNMRIVVLEDDPDQSELLLAWLHESGHVSKVYRDGKAFIRAYKNESFDLVILDWMVPEASGLQVLRHLRADLDPTVPVIFVTQRDSEQDVVEALEAGADDYMTKPVRRGELLARVNVVARRLGLGASGADSVIDLPPYTINTKSRSISLRGEELDMTQKEYELAVFLFRNLGRVISRGHLLEMVWGTSSKINTRTVDTHVSRLRNKLELDDQPDWKLTSVYRHGYRLERDD
jgi:DNA-binding response OmpR family regulator